jgi:hypothetical protein
MDDAAVAECFQTLVADAGSLNLADLLGDPASRKNASPGRSKR